MQVCCSDISIGIPGLPSALRLEVSHFYSTRSAYVRVVVKDPRSGAYLIDREVNLLTETDVMTAIQIMVAIK